ncbi:heavy metal translocating P-type ATPase [Candidatus Parabeggiatoa sp. HSG14]|uniref:heavy metal translocating P-type ATPase n=1 Tax=Candidatus Parabeggiatoa sp. HSG14 TaxID=3055593 RepID=UPI0025A7FABC|nr:heavy metal translocating P-type ATPase [Thiotrichales bacterium HSG14]
MTKILIVGAALGYTVFKVYQGYKETKKTKISPSLSTPKKVILKKEKITLPSDMVINNQPVEENLPVVTDENLTNEIKKSAERDFIVSSASLGLTTVGALVYPPLIIASIAGMVYLTIPIWQKGYHSLFKKRQIDIAVIDSIALPGIFLTGHFFIAAIAFWLYALSQKLLLKTEDQSVKSLINIFGEQPNFVWILKDNIEIEIPFDALKVGDIIVVNAGEAIPIDGMIANGVASIDQHTLTGESQPVEKGIGDKVFASTIMLSGKINIQVKQTGEDTVAAKIGEILISTIDFKTSIQSRGQEIADKSALPTLILSGLAIPVAGHTGALAVLGSCLGDNVRITSPISVLNFLKIASEQSILIKDGRALELLSKVDTVVFDKTGTLTQEQPHVGKIYTLQERKENELLRYAAAAEYKQAHPIAKAIIQAANERELNLPDIDNAKYDVGYGIKVNIENQLIQVGSIRFMEMENIAIPYEIKQIISDCHDSGHSLVMIAIDNQLAGAIELHATIRPEAKSIIKDLHQRNISTYIISGDHEKPTQRLAKELGIDNYFAETLPENKATLIQQLIDAGKVVCFVGDGINDSIALKKAHVSISLKGASTIATDTAQIILMDESLKHLCQVFDLANHLDKNLNTGLITTIVPGLITIGSVFLIHMGIIGSIVVFNAGLLAGVTNSMWPLVEHHQKKKSK